MDDFGLVFGASVLVISIVNQNFNTWQCFVTNPAYTPRNDDGENPGFWESILTELQRAGLQFKLSGSFSMFFGLQKPE